MQITRVMLSAGLLLASVGGGAAYAQDMANQSEVVISTSPNPLNAIEPRGGRDPRGGFYGRQTVWPGDYHDALDRQQGNMYSAERGGRDPNGGFYGRDTVWPGDYHDALDRGEFPAGGPRIMPTRTFNRY